MTVIQIISSSMLELWPNSNLCNCHIVTGNSLLQFWKSAHCDVIKSVPWYCLVFVPFQIFGRSNKSLFFCKEGVRVESSLFDVETNLRHRFNWKTRVHSWNSLGSHRSNHCFVHMWVHSKPLLVTANLFTCLGNRPKQRQECLGRCKMQISDIWN